MADEHQVALAVWHHWYGGKTGDPGCENGPPPYLEPQKVMDKMWFKCTLCRVWYDESHSFSKKHRNNVEEWWLNNAGKPAPPMLQPQLSDVPPPPPGLPKPQRSDVPPPPPSLPKPQRSDVRPPPPPLPKPQQWQREQEVQDSSKVWAANTSVTLSQSGEIVTRYEETGMWKPNTQETEQKGQASWWSNWDAQQHNTQPVTQETEQKGRWHRKQDVRKGGKGGWQEWEEEWIAEHWQKAPEAQQMIKVAGKARSLEADNARQLNIIKGLEKDKNALQKIIEGLKASIAKADATDEKANEEAPNEEAPAAPHPDDEKNAYVDLTLEQMYEDLAWPAS